MKVVITNRSIRQITLATLAIAILCISGRADPMAEPKGDPKRDPTGACCLFDGLCIVVTESQCQTDGGIYQGDDVTCDDAVCAPLGACCIPFDICVVSTIQECTILGGVIWAPGQDCGTFTCPPLGACCDPDDDCFVTSQSSCANVFGGIYQGDGVACKDSSCAPCIADFDGDGMVTTGDLLLLFGAWGPNPGHPADLDGNGEVATADLLILFSFWGQCS
ncbi:MAG: hypothetical protein IH984_16440 [Planctomycetes bacterium]|nr:hypothetical protein [Planctomycetota bacterium]